MNTAFAYGMFYIDVISWLNILMLVLTIIILHKSLKETIMMTGVGAVFAMVMDAIVPYHIW